MTGTNTVSVEFCVVAIERVPAAGRLQALATVAIDIAGIEVVIQGVRVVRTPTGLECRAPCWRHPRSGGWVPAAILPPELTDAIAGAVLAAWSDL